MVAGFQNDNFTRNLTALLAEGRWDLATYVPQGVAVSRSTKATAPNLQRAGALLASAYAATGVGEQHLRDVLDAAEKGDPLARAALAQDARRLAAYAPTAEDIAALRALADAIDAMGRTSH